jgi:uncharacterized protein YndB with AHSA1/START domain
MDDQQEVTITRVYDAPRELVWRAWTEPDELARWWGTAGWSVVEGSIVADTRVGGTFRIGMVRDDGGAEMQTEGVYREVWPPEHLVFEEPSEGNWHGGGVSTLTLTELEGGRTRMELHTIVATTEEMKGVMERGMGENMDRLGRHLVEGVRA